jgi:hypothetical protein
LVETLPEPEEELPVERGWNSSRRRIPCNKMIRALPEAEIQWGWDPSRRSSRYKMVGTLPEEEILSKSG